MPAAAVRTLGALNDDRLHLATGAGTGAGPGPQEAAGRGLLSALAHDALLRAVSGTTRVTPSAHPTTTPNWPSSSPPPAPWRLPPNCSTSARTSARRRTRCWPGRPAATGAGRSARGSPAGTPPARRCAICWARCSSRRRTRSTPTTPGCPSSATSPRDGGRHRAGALPADRACDRLRHGARPAARRRPGRPPCGHHPRRPRGLRHQHGPCPPHHRHPARAAADASGTAGADATAAQPAAPAATPGSGDDERRRGRALGPLRRGAGRAAAYRARRARRGRRGGRRAARRRRRLPHGAAAGRPGSVPVRFYGRQAVVGPFPGGPGGDDPCGTCLERRWQAVRSVALREALEIGSGTRAAGDSPYATPSRRTRSPR
ncbi:hypothetical protein ACFQ60_32190 [Streptomyces zhihengii]